MLVFQVRRETKTRFKSSPASLSPGVVTGGRKDSGAQVLRDS